MRSGTISNGTFPGPIDLQATLESGQTFLWSRLDGRTYATEAPSGGRAWYRTVQDGGVVDVRQTPAGLEWRGTEDGSSLLRSRLGLDDDLEAILSTVPNDPLLQAAIDRYRGLRLVEEPFFGTLVSFILSAQMRIPRIHRLVTALASEYGTEVRFDDESIAEFPSPTSLARATESELRDLGLGYRAPYVLETAQMVADGVLDPETVAELPYEEAREALTTFVGVGEKVADCVLLFSLGFAEPVPLDTWIRSTIEEHFPTAARGSYGETSTAIRETFGPYPGYAQTYVFHHLRTGGGSAGAAD